MSALKIAIALLVADSGVAGIVGARVYPIAAPQKAPMPYIVVTLVSEPDEQMLEGAGRYFDALVSVASHAASGGDADDLGEAVKDAISDVINQAVGAATATVMKDGADVMDFSDDRTLYRRITDYRLRWR